MKTPTYPDDFTKSRQNFLGKFPKTIRIYINSFPNAAGVKQKFKDFVGEKVSKVFGNPSMWLLAAFENVFVLTLAAF
jgi:hypothetical protein